MADHASAKKRARQTIKRTQRNRLVRSEVRTFLKRTRQALSNGRRDEAQQLFARVVAEIDKAVSKGVFHRKTASRYISRLASGLNAA